MVDFRRLCPMCPFPDNAVIFQRPVVNHYLPAPAAQSPGFLACEPAIKAGVYIVTTPPDK
jgi:hypothetical protein